MVGHQGLVIPEIAVSQEEHQPVAQRIEELTGAGLRNAGSPAASRREGRYRQRGRPSEGRARRASKVRGQLEEVQVAVVRKVQEITRGTSGRRRRTFGGR